MKEKDNYLSCYCGRCNQDTNHDVLSSERVGSDNDDFWWQEIYSIAKCRGCGELTFLLQSSSEDDYDYDEDGNAFIATRISTYPKQRPIASGLRHYWSVPNSISGVYKETIIALNNSCLMLAAAGFRTIIEATCMENNISGKTLESKINNLCKANIITKRDRDRLHSIRFLGNDSVHQMKSPTVDILLLVLEIIDIMLKNLYILEEECRNALEGPITKFADFIELLDEGLKNRSVGEIDILRNLLASSRRLIKEDLRGFETELIEQIQEGKYAKLSLSPSQQVGKKQQYKVVAV